MGLLARTQPDLDDAAAEITDAGGTAVVLAADVSDPTQTGEALDRLVSELGHVEVLVNNAAVVWPLGPTQDLDPKQVAAAIAINVTGAMTLTGRVLPAMIAAGWGRIVNVSAAIAEHTGMLVGINTYATSKGALETHTLNLAAELAGTGVTANVYRPGTVDTAMQAYIRDQPGVPGGLVQKTGLSARRCRSRPSGRRLLRPCRQRRPLQIAPVPLDRVRDRIVRRHRAC